MTTHEDVIINVLQHKDVEYIMSLESEVFSDYFAKYITAYKLQAYNAIHYYVSHT